MGTSPSWESGDGMTELAKSSVFTTLRWDGGFSVAHFEEHLTRLKEHASRLSIEWPVDAREQALSTMLSVFSNVDESNQDDCVGLANLNLNLNGEMSASTRWKQVNSDSHLKITRVSATAIPAPRWKVGITGCKHGDWQPYKDAGAQAAERGCEIALLIHNEAVVDCQLATPLLLDDDGTAWYPAPSEGALDSISLASIQSHLEQEGIPLIPGRLTRNLLSRARALVAIGTGIGVVLITELDGQPIGNDSDNFANLCFESFYQALESGWTDIQEESL